MKQNRKYQKPFNANEFLARQDVKEHTAYLVDVCYSGGNPIHRAILFIGFKTGGYCELYTNNYETPIPLHRVYYMKVLSELCSLETSKYNMANDVLRVEPIGSDW